MSSEAASNAIAELSLAPRTDTAKLIQLPEALLPYRQTGFAYIASLYSIGAGFPLDSVKTRLQTYKYNSVWHCIVETKRSEGIGGFYRGIVAPLTSSAFVRAASVAVYSSSLATTSQFFFSLYRPPTEGTPALEKIARMTPGVFFAGCIAGASCTLVSSPFEFTKLVSQIELLLMKERMGAAAGGTAGQIVASSTWKVARGLVAKNGVKALYSGYRYHLLRDLIGSGVYFTVYDGFKTGISSVLGKKAHPASVAIGGALAGTFSWIIVYPLDTLKSVVQRDCYSTMMGFTKKADIPKRKLSNMIHRGMYRGLGVSLARTSIMGMMFFSSYEWMIKNF
ncbi:mitochondrial carnitine carrier [Trichomonascus vanleenenianus]|uniref:mitochondrial carnitine carrier n=1 Tax=Trichomonascus vanleenenianus TaxID=2268995 RepID=UPI003ECABA45